MLANDSEPAFLNSVADWFETVEERCLCPVLTLKIYLKTNSRSYYRKYVWVCFNKKIPKWFYQKTD